MRKIAALSFLVLTGTALMIKLAQEPRTHAALSHVMQFVPDFQVPSTARVRVEAFSTLAMPVPAHVSQPESKPQPPAETQVTLVLAGDTGLNGSFQPVYASFGLKGGSRLSFEEATPAIAPVINGDINFANLETVVTDRNDLTASLKLFGFRTHPKGVQHLLDRGFNIFSTANNHSMDYGLEGARETLKHRWASLKRALARRGPRRKRRAWLRPKVCALRLAQWESLAVAILRPAAGKRVPVNCRQGPSATSMML